MEEERTLLLQAVVPRKKAQKRKRQKKGQGRKEGILEAAAGIAPQGHTQMTFGDRSASAALYSPQGGLE